MDVNKRRLIKALPLMALAGVATKISGTEAKQIALNPSLKYVFVVPADCGRQGVEDIAAGLKARGIDNAVVMTDNVQIFEIH